MKSDIDKVSMTGLDNLSLSLSIRTMKQSKHQWQLWRGYCNCQAAQFMSNDLFQRDKYYVCATHMIDEISFTISLSGQLQFSFLHSSLPLSLCVCACLCLEVIPIVPDVISLITTINTNTITSSQARPKQHKSNEEACKILSKEKILSCLFWNGYWKTISR